MSLGNPPDVTQGHKQTAKLLDAGLSRPLPAPSWLSQPFWDAAAVGRVRIQRCDDCAHYVFRPEYSCTHCFGSSLTWTDTSGYGVVHSYSIVRRPAYPEMPSEYAVVSVKMHEDWYMMSNLIGIPIEGMHIGLPVMVKHIAFNSLYLPFVVPRQHDLTADL